MDVEGVMDSMESASMVQVDADTAEFESMLLPVISNHTLYPKGLTSAASTMRR